MVWVFCLVKENLVGEWAKPFFLALARLGAVGIHLSGIDLVVVGTLVSCLLQVVYIVLFFGRLKY